MPPKNTEKSVASRRAGEPSTVNGHTAAASSASKEKEPSCLDPSEITKVKICSGHTRPICHVNYSRCIDGTHWFVTSCHDAKPMLRNGQTGDWVGTFDGHKGAVFSSCFNAEATRLVTASGDYTAKVWNALTGECLHTWDHPNYIKSCDWLGHRIATGARDGMVCIYDVGKIWNDEEVCQSFSGGGKSTVKATYLLDENIVVCALDDVINKFDLRGKVAKAVQTTTVKDMNVLEYNHEHHMTAAHLKSISFIDPNTLKVVGGFDTPEEVECGSLSPNGKTVAVGSKIKVKEFTLDGVELESHRGHHGPIFHIRWAPDGMSLSSGAEDGMVRIWPSHDIIVKYQNQ